ncbi:ATP-grasp domain-containing protein [Parahaliea mediterranea]|uniref:arsenate reductase/protein-tyrosine-phosphatase family protein n=1 Tax=Parahaliea mediterranea TaxID=651086 RepID=UPI000E2FF22A|nr:ATP-grasp domain-containing protein [Parahaliea mediterranea]
MLMTRSDTLATVLVLDADTLPALAIIRSLGRSGVRVLAASSRSKSIGSYSRYALQHLHYPDPMSQTEAFLNWMEGKLTDIAGLAMVIPVTERSLVPLSRHFATSDRRALFAMADDQALEQVLDKSQTAALAARVQVSQPRSWLINSIEALDSIVTELPFPLVIKPARSISDSDTRQHHSVHYAHILDDLRRSARTTLPHTDLILQEYFYGDGVGIEVLASRGEILYAFQHRRLHEVPLSGGGSSLRRSEEVNPELLEASRRLLSALDWTGVAMVEFKVQTDSGRYILVEINGRFWGSLPLALAAGADFPLLLWHLQCGLPLPALPAYRRGVLCHKLSSELSWCEAVMRRQADTRLVALPSRFEALRETLSMLLPGHHLDAQSWSDPLPGLIDLWRTASRYARRAGGAIAATTRQTICRFGSRRSVIDKRVAQARHILFICYGNINRSALAEATARDKAGSLNNIEFRSAGFHPEADRAPDPHTVALAAAQGIDMSHLRSRVLDEEMAHWADLILVMESGQVFEIKRRFPNRPVLLLGGLLETGWLAREIPDPYNRSEDTYKQAFRQVTGAIDNLIAARLTGAGSD